MKYLYSLCVLLMIGLVYASDYTYSDGYYWLGDKAYTRELYQNPGYWYCGVYYPGTSYYRYTEVPVVTKYKTKTVNYTDPDWRSKLLDIAAQRDKFEGEIRKGAYEQAYFLDSVKALGLQGNFNWSGYGATPPGYGIHENRLSYGYGHLAFGANATTKYTYNNLSHLYGDGDLNQLYQAANQLAQNAQKLGGEATSGFHSLASQEGSNRARVAEIIAKGQMAQQIIQALDSAPNGVSKLFSFRFNEQGVFEKKENSVDPKAREELSQQFEDVAKNRCASCHSGATKKGGFDVYRFPTMSSEEKQKVLTRLVTENETLLMPRALNGSPGKKLTAEEFRAFLLVPSVTVPSMSPVER